MDECSICDTPLSADEGWDSGGGIILCLDCSQNAKITEALDDEASLLALSVGLARAFPSEA